MIMLYNLNGSSDLFVAYVPHCVCFWWFMSHTRCRIHQHIYVWLPQRFRLIYGEILSSFWFWLDHVFYVEILIGWVLYKCSLLADFWVDDSDCWVLFPGLWLAAFCMGNSDWLLFCIWDFDWLHVVLWILIGCCICVRDSDWLCFVSCIVIGCCFCVCRFWLAVLCHGF